MKRQFLNIDQLCEYITYSKSAIYKRVDKKTIPFHKIGSKLIFDVEEINTWVRSDGVIIRGRRIEPTDFNDLIN